MKKRLLSMALTLCMVLTLLPATALADPLPPADQAQWGTAGIDGSAPSSGWTQGTLAAAISHANSASSTTYIQLLDDINKDNHTTWPLEFNADKTTILDLHGKDIDRKLESPTSDGNVITVKGNLTLKDSSTDTVAQQGRITGGWNSSNSGGGVFVVSVGTFIMQGGNITANKSTSSDQGGGGVNVSSGSFIMNGGSIHGNESNMRGGAVYTADNQSFTMNGGSITDNKSSQGALFINRNFTVGGTAVIKNNKNGTDAECNVWALTGKPIKVSEDTPLTTGAIIGITAENKPTVHSALNIVTGSAMNYSAYFSSDESSIYRIQNKSEDNSLWLEVIPSDIDLVAEAKDAAQNASYANMTQAAATDDGVIKTALKSTAESAVNNSGITVTIAAVSYTTPAAGTSAYPSGTNGVYTFNVTVSKGSHTATTSDKAIDITATPYAGVTDEQAVAAAKTAATNAPYANMTQAMATDEGVIKTALRNTAESAVSNSGITVTIAAVSYTTPAAGTSAYPSGTKGVYTFNVTVSKGSHTATTSDKAIDITATPYAGVTDEQAVTAAKIAATNAPYANMTQTAATDEGVIKMALKNTAETAVSNSGIAVTIAAVSYTTPAAGTSANHGGTDGSYAFKVTVSKGIQTATTSEKAITITATPYTGGSGGGSNKPAPPAKPTEPITGSTENKATVDENGNASVSLTGKNITDAIADAKAEAAKKGVNPGDITAVIHVTTGGKDASMVTVNLPKTTQEQAMNNKIASLQLVIDRPNLTIGMDLAAVAEMNHQAQADLQLSATRLDSTKLSGEAQAAIGSRPAFDLKATYGSGNSVTDFGKGSIRIEIPYTLQKGEIASNVYAVYVDAKGKVTYLTDSVYDAKRAAVVFSTNHFSTYGIAYKAGVDFTDIDGHWAKEDILFVANRSIMTGTGDAAFSPNGSMTRGMFVTALGRLADADVSGYTKSSFTDVKADAYYMGYIEWGVKNDTLVGIGGGKFNPDGLVTREQMAAIMDRYATSVGVDLPASHPQNTFADSTQVGEWAVPSVKRIQRAGIIQGKENNLYDPQGAATRAEVSAVLRRFMEVSAFSDTAQ